MGCGWAPGTSLESGAISRIPSVEAGPGQTQLGLHGAADGDDAEAAQPSGIQVRGQGTEVQASLAPVVAGA
jgi:hypothetical protein